MSGKRGEVVSINPRDPELDVIERALGILDDGGLLVAPTETRYGLVARADHESAIEKVFAVKRRDRAKPISMFVGHVGFFKYYADAGPLAQRLAELYLPGPLTLVLKAADHKPHPLAVDGRIGLRISASPVVAALVERTDYPLTATSANRSGQPMATEVEDIRRELGDEIDLYLDGGPLDGPTSTVVDCADSCIVLREGSIKESEIMAVAKE